MGMYCHYDQYRTGSICMFIKLREQCKKLSQGKLIITWKAYKSAMKKTGFNKDKTLEENLANRHADVVESQWVPLVIMWKDKENQTLATKNAENISKQTVKHIGGSKPHMEYAREEGSTSTRMV